MRPTIRQVAERLNLSIATVSRALDGYYDVAATTRQLVIETAREMGYVPNRAARELRRGRADSIGFIIPSLGTGFSDPFFSDFIAGLGDEASLHGYDLLVTTAPTDKFAEQELYRRWAQGGKVDGMVVNRVRMKDWRFDYLAELKIPHVSLERSVSQSEFVGIETDSYKGVLGLMAHLIARGRKEIAYIGGDPELKIDFDRQRAYLDGLKRAEIDPVPNFILHADLTHQGGYLAAKNLLSLKKPPTAIVCINDLTAIGAMRAAHEHGLVVGRDIAVAGFDGIADSAHTQPSLTTLEQPVKNIARQLAQMLVTLIKGEPLEQRGIKIKSKLVIRESTGGE